MPRVTDLSNEPAVLPVIATLQPAADAVLSPDKPGACVECELTFTPQTVLLELPTGPELPNEFGIHVDGKLTARQATAWRKMLAGMICRGDKLANGRPVETGADALRRVCEMLAEAYDPPAIPA